jgi:hypothetical protein
MSDVWPSVLWVVNVFDRAWDLQVQLRLLRRHFGKRIDIHVYCSGPLERGVTDEIMVVGRTDDRQNGFRDALRYTAGAGMQYDVVVSSHAKAWATDYSVIESMIQRFWADGTQVAILDPGQRGCMMDDDKVGMYCDLIVVRGELSGLLYHRDDFHGLFPEKMAHRWILRHCASIKHIFHNGGRLTNPSSGHFVFGSLDGSESELLCSYISDEKWGKLSDEYRASVDDIFQRWRSHPDDPLPSTPP